MFSMNQTKTIQSGKCKPLCITMNAKSNLGLEGETEWVMVEGDRLNIE